MVSPVQTDDQKLRAYLKKVTMDLRQARQRLREVKFKNSEPVAIVGMACRYPGGVRRPEDLWELISDGVDAIGEFPTNRGWDLDSIYHSDPSHQGTTYVRTGGFIYDADEFDADMFRISPREALAMDPQQRLLLETSWEAVERAGLAANTLRGRDVGVFIGAAPQDYWPRVDDAAGREVEGYLGVGNTTSVLSGRIAYTLGLRGPALTVDTACSSSLVALHLAVQSVRRGECAMALTGGVTIMSSPNWLVSLSRQRAVAPDGRSKAFSALADGYGPSEGAGIVVVERLSDALNAGHNVLAVVRGSAVNQDGASNGLTAPNEEAQEQVIRAALVDAGLECTDVDLIETHGTGTELGDPIEVNALLATYGKDRSEDLPLYLGSLKSNIGHTQAASGIGGVIKVVESLRRRQLPKTLHVEQPTSHVDWEHSPLSLVSEQAPWESRGRPRRAGVSSFGISGTNAHAILEQAPDLETDSVGVVEPGGLLADGSPLVVTGRSETALCAQAATLRDYIEENPTAGQQRIARALALTRAALPHRAVVMTPNLNDAARCLDAIADGQFPSQAVCGTADVRGGVAFVFPGQGWQWWGMAARLRETSPVFAAKLAECDEALRAFTGFSAVDRLVGEQGDTDSVDDVVTIHCASWAVMVSLAELWRSVGVEPAAVVGHSMGELAAAVVSGALSLEAAGQVVAVRSQILRDSLFGNGGMVSVGLPATEASERIARWAERAAVAAVNGPSTTVVAADNDVLDAFLSECESEGIHCRRIALACATHSAHVEPIHDQLIDALRNIEPRASRIPFYSTVTGGRIDTVELDADYWYRNMRHTVRLDPAIRAMASDGLGFFVESSGHPVLTFGVEETIADVGVNAVALGTLRRNEGGPNQFLAAVAAGFVRGLEVDWERVFSEVDHSPVDLPTYAFQRRRYWLEPQGAAGDVAAAGLEPVDHGLLSAAAPSAASDQHLLFGRISRKSHPWLYEHRIHGAVVLPNTVLVDLALCAGREVGCTRLDEFVVEHPVSLAGTGDAVQLQVSVSGAESGDRELAIYTRGAADGDAPWTRHARGSLRVDDIADADDPSMEQWPPAGANSTEIDGVYDVLGGLDREWGPAFHGLRAMWSRGEELYAEISLPEALRGAARRHTVHPALLEAAVHLAQLSGSPGENLDVPIEWRGISWLASNAVSARVRVVRGEDGAISLHLFDNTGAAVLSVQAIRTGAYTGQSDGLARGKLLELDWKRAAHRPDDVDTSKWSIMDLDDLNLADVLDLRQSETPEVVLISSGRDEVEDRHPAESTRESIKRLSVTMRRWATDLRLGSARLAVVTKGAVSVSDDTMAPDIARAAVAGMVRSAQREHPGRILLVDLDDKAGSVAALSATIHAAIRTSESELAIRDGVTWVPRTRRADTGSDGSTRLGSEGTVLVTKGVNDLSDRVARHLVSGHGVRDMMLVCDEECRDDGAKLAAELSDLGAVVNIAYGDVTDRAFISKAVDSISDDQPLTAVVHAWGTGSERAEPHDTERFANVLASKIDVAQHLHTLTADRELSHFVLFSSTMGSFGGLDWVDQACAAAALDALAQLRRRKGLPAVSIAWGPTEASNASTAEQAGVRPIPDDDVPVLFDAAISADRAVSLPVWIDTAELGMAELNSVPAYLSHMVRPQIRQATRGESHAGFQTRFVGELVGTSRPEQRRAALRLVQTEAAEVLKHSSVEDVTPNRAFKDLGFESMTSVELRNRLNSATGLALPPTLVYTYPTPAELAEFLLEELNVDGSDPEAPISAELDRLEETLAGLSPRARLREEITKRLRVMLRAWESDAGGGDDTSIREVLDAASDEEMFAFIDKELDAS